MIVVEQDTLMIDFLIKKSIKYLRNTMKKIFISIFIITLSFSFVNAEEIKQTKQQVKEKKKKGMRR